MGATVRSRAQLHGGYQGKVHTFRLLRPDCFGHGGQAVDCVMVAQSDPSDMLTRRQRAQRLRSQETVAVRAVRVQVCICHGLMKGSSSSVSMVCAAGR